MKSNPGLASFVDKKLSSVVGQKVNSVRKVSQARKLVNKTVDIGLLWADMVYRPFGRYRPKIGLPFYNVSPSLTTRFYSTITGTIGTAGVGWVAIRASLANDNALGRYTTATYTGTTFDSGAVGVVGITPSTLPYDAATLSGGTVKARPVACGVKAWYSGQARLRSGNWYVFRDPAMASVATSGGTKDVAYLASRIGCHTGPVGGGKVAVAIIPIDVDQFDYGTTALPFGSDYIAIIAIVGTAGETFTFEVNMDVEYIGAPVDASGQKRQNSRKTPSDMMQRALAASDAMLGMSGSMIIGRSALESGEIGELAEVGEVSAVPLV